MTVPSNVAWGSAVGTNITGPYAIPFGLYTQSWLKVLIVSNNVPAFPSLGTDYTFTAWVPDNKGWVANPQITFTNPVVGGALIVFILVPPGTQNSAISNFSAFFPQIHEMTFDQLTQLSLMLLQWAGKTLKAPDWEYAGQANLTLPPIAVRANNLLAFDNSGDVEVVPLTTVPNTTPVSNFWQPILLLTTAVASLQALGAYLINTATNTFMGVSAGNTSLSGAENVGIGNYVLPNVTSGNSNVAIGATIQAVTSGNSNVFIGHQTGNETTTGSTNTYVGQQAGTRNVTGSNNIALGSYAGSYQTASNLLVVDNQDRGSSGVEETNAILFGTMASTPQAQTLNINAVIQMASFTTTQRTALTPVEGMVVYDSTLHYPMYYNGSSWVEF